MTPDQPVAHNEVYRERPPDLFTESMGPEDNRRRRSAALNAIRYTSRTIAVLRSTHREAEDRSWCESRSRWLYFLDQLENERVRRWGWETE